MSLRRRDQMTSHIEHPIPTPNQVRETAIRACRAGISVVPVSEDGTKSPALPAWKAYQQERPSEEQVAAWFQYDRKGIGFICGHVSGGLEVLDFDDLATYDALRERAQAVGMGDLLARIESGYKEYSPNDVHLLYRCPAIEKNLKLAQRQRSNGEKKDPNDRVKVD